MMMVAMWFWIRFYLAYAFLIIAIPIAVAVTGIANFITIIWGVRRVERGLEEIEDSMIAAHFKDGPINRMWIDVKFESYGIMYECRTHILRFLSKQKRKQILLIHGTASSSMSFANLIPDLFREFDVIAIDLPGFGRTSSISDSLQKTSHEEILAFYTQFIECCLLETVKSDKISIIAHSFGAFIAAHYAIRFPSRVDKLILISCAGLLPTLGENGAYWSVVFKKSVLHHGRLLGSIGKWMFSFWFFMAGLDLEYHYWFIVLSNCNGDKCLARFIDLTWTSAEWIYPLINHISQIQCPVTLIYGEHDDIVPHHQAKLLNQVFSIDCRVIPDAGHSPMRGEGVFTILMDSLNENDKKIKRNIKIIEKGKYRSSFSTTTTKETIELLYNDIISSCRNNTSFTANQPSPPSSPDAPAAQCDGSARPGGCFCSEACRA